MMTRSQSRAGAGAQALMMTRSQSRAQARIPSPTRFMTRGQDQGQDHREADADRIPHLDFDAASRAWRANKRALPQGCFEYVEEPTEEEGRGTSTRKSGRNQPRRVPAGPERFGTWNYCTPMTD